MAGYKIVIYFNEDSGCWNLLTCVYVFQTSGKRRKRRKARSSWVRQWLSHQRRQLYGHYTSLLNELRTEDEKSFFNYTRLPRGLYDEILQRIEGRIEKRSTWFRQALSPGLKLAITLRHLACGDSYKSLSYNFRVAHNTIFSLLVADVCNAIITEYATEAIQCPTSEEEWAAIAEVFQSKWQFPHCCGALDGKHVAIVCPRNSGSLFRNYKGFFSIVLMALVDADYKFL